MHIPLYHARFHSARPVPNLLEKHDPSVFRVLLLNSLPQTADTRRSAQPPRARIRLGATMSLFNKFGCFALALDVAGVLTAMEGPALEDDGVRIGP